MIEIREQFAFVEKYRPQRISECVLPTSIKNTLLGILQQQNTPNLLLVGKPGTGKTTVARAIARELDADVLFINASEDNGIDVIRTRIREFASCLSLNGKRKCVILDESDYLHPASAQPALRGFMEEFAHSCTFILTANFIQKIITPLHSRCSIVEFKVPASERPDVAVAFYTRVTDILKRESIAYEDAVVRSVIMTYFPDFRRILNEIQRFSLSGTLSKEILSQVTDADIHELFTAIKAKQFATVRKWIALHEDMDSTAFYRMMSEQIFKMASDDTIASMIVVLADYSYRSAFSADAQLNQIACLIEIMSEGKWK